jgi:hypothetical protein
MVTGKAFGQLPIEVYKKSVDSFMAIYLDTSVLNRLTCNSYMATLKGQNTVVYSGEYDAERGKVLENVGAIGFFYDYYNPQLNYSFHWYLNLQENGKVLPASMLSKTLPACIQRGQPCNLITKDAAVKIAQADSMRFPTNYYVEFLSPKQSNNFYWVITGVDKNEHDYSIPPKEGIDAPIPNRKKSNTRIIEASTGNIIPLQEYYKLDKD